jgi:predicted nucleic acid-binding protein
MNQNMSALQKFKRVSDLPEENKFYRLVLSNKANYSITGQQKNYILNSTKTFIELSDGSIINKSFILEIYLDKEMTKKKWKTLTEQHLLQNG